MVVESRQTRIDACDLLLEVAPLVLIGSQGGFGGLDGRGCRCRATIERLLGGRQFRQPSPRRFGGGVERLQRDQGFENGKHVNVIEVDVTTTTNLRERSL
jgi:hypothetical protein